METGEEEFVSVVDEARVLVEQAGEVSELLQAQGQAWQLSSRAVCENRAGFQAQLDEVRGEVAALLDDLAAVEAENDRLREDAAARIELVRAVSERVGSLKQLSLSEAAAAANAARRSQVEQELAEAKQDVTRLQAAIDAAITSGQETAGVHDASRRGDTAKMESLQLDLRRALQALRDAKQAARERESRYLASAKAASVAATEPLQAELVAIAQQVHAYEKAALEQSRADGDEKARQQVLAAETNVLRGELLQQSEQVAALQATVADAECAAANAHGLQAALDKARYDAELAREQVAQSTAAAAKIAKQSAADAAALESLEYLHGVLPSQQGSAGDCGEDEVERLRSELSEAMVLSESRMVELEAARLESRVAEEKYCQLVASHAAVRPNDWDSNFLTAQMHLGLISRLHTGSRGSDTARP